MSVRKRADPRYPGKDWLTHLEHDGRRTRRRFGTQAEALAFERSWRQRVNDTPARGIEEALLEVARTHWPNLKKPDDPKSHARTIRALIAGKTFDDSQEVARAIRREFAHLSRATINRRLALLRQLGNLAESWGWIERAPKIKLLAESGRDVMLTRAQVERLAARMARCGDIVLLATYTGLRRMELLSLTADNVRPEALVLESLKKRKRTKRIVPVPERARHILASVPFEVTPQILRKEWETARAAEGWPTLRFHDLRHTYAAFLVESGLSDRVVMELLGVSDARLVQRYAYLRGEYLASAVAKL